MEQKKEDGRERETEIRNIVKRSRRSFTNCFHWLFLLFIIIHYWHYTFRDNGNMTIFFFFFFFRFLPFPPSAFIHFFFSFVSIRFYIPCFSPRYLISSLLFSILLYHHVSPHSRRRLLRILQSLLQQENVLSSLLAKRSFGNYLWPERYQLFFFHLCLLSFHGSL